eukprot:CAMPEP_0168455718 /NCGR_PEP_ID=MMETSP0228-20121227/50900_1 /TAXON_ID=133427 /ORGANISM="Protoceratium reticulatum, Strain CCCM 535 (=CCMP 1889)" /LENGTH=80 /DNA_ID=CAMNT_0008470583 /DNA_START=132 /DNA_END=371 /DNA_ORIENTATION=+
MVQTGVKGQRPLAIQHNLEALLALAAHQYFETVALPVASQLMSSSSFQSVHDPTMFILLNLGSLTSPVFPLLPPCAAAGR